MDDFAKEFEVLASKLLTENAEDRERQPKYITQGQEAIRRRQKLVRALLEHKRIPGKGWDHATIEWLLKDIAMLDSNNFYGNVGAGEREGRIASSIVQRRHFYLGHGIGRSGDVFAVQPKAAGSSLIYKLTTAMIRDVFWRVFGMRNLKGFLVLPMATGMTIALTLMALRKHRPPTAVYVLWPRIDQKTCLKSIITAGLTPVVVNEVLDGDSVKTNLADIKRKISDLGEENVLCVLSTTSCFAPRVPDDVEEISKICLEAGIGHIINNAYGLQCSKCCHRVNMACRNGRVDAVIQSTDKNLLVPVGGAIVAGPNKSWIESTLSKTYPGRASLSPILDVFITLLELGIDEYTRIRKRRIQLIESFTIGLEKVASKHGERLLKTENKISFAVTLNNLNAKSQSEITKFGSMMFQRGISGARVVARNTRKSISGFDFDGYGASIDNYHSNYFTVACAIGIKQEDIDLLISRIDKTMSDSFKTQKF